MNINSNISSAKENWFYRIFKRTFDIIFSTILIILTSPIWIITIIGIKISSPGPVFYIANRVGLGGELFSMYKFRSMHIDESANEKGLRPEQSRIFPFGQFLRNIKIDELPQVLNVFLGHMTVVGPRPAARDQVGITRFGKYKILNSLKPGLTSPSALYDYIFGDQVVNESDYEMKILPTRLALDLYYIQKQGFFYDLKIIAYTGFCIVARLIKISPKFIYDELVLNSKKIVNN
jgi:lipopolysaccharide/colanic/teichoic acid biosynthesis glycosyltransferase